MGELNWDGENRREGEGVVGERDVELSIHVLPECWGREEKGRSEEKSQNCLLQVDRDQEYGERNRF